MDMAYYRAGMTGKIEGITATLIAFQPLEDAFESMLQMPEFRAWCNERLQVTFVEG